MKSKCSVCGKKLIYYAEDEIETFFYLKEKAFCCEKEYISIYPNGFTVVNFLIFLFIISIMFFPGIYSK